jgi:hypothetical protein
MARQTVISRKVKKKRGPPATGKGTPVLVRLQPAELRTLDEFAVTQEDKPSRPEALRRMAGFGRAQVNGTGRRAPVQKVDDE